MKTLFTLVLILSIYNCMLSQTLEIDGSVFFNNIDESSIPNNILVIEPNGKVSHSVLSTTDIHDSDWLKIGTGTTHASVNDSIYTLGHVGIGSSGIPNDPLSLGSSLGANQMNFNSCDFDVAYSSFGASCPSTIKALGTVIIDFDHNNNSTDQNFVITKHQGQELFRVDDNSNIGIGSNNPKEKLHISNGNIYLEQANSSVILTSQDGNCWSLTIDNSGSFITTSTSCP